MVRLDGGPVAARLLLDMSGAIAHRGPDDEGYVLIDRAAGSFRTFAGASSSDALRERERVLARDTEDGSASIGMGHRRFSIVDLSDAGHQPFCDSDRTCCVVFNGEIYNHKELRAELEAAGVTFRTRSDTEVLVESYKRWGTACFSRFNGFWALALYDFRSGRLLLSRDRLGKKPLFWTRVGQSLYFASEIKALLRVPEVLAARRVNETAAARWLTYGRKDTDLETLFEGIFAHRPGSWSVVNDRFPATGESFWSLPTERLGERDISVSEAATQLRELLRDSVRLRTDADVPVAVELSGGMDSSSLVALAAQVMPGRVTTYTVRFPGAETDEEPYARAVAERYGVDYRVLDPPVEAFWQHVGSFTRLEEEPYHAPNLQVNQLIWAQMRERGTKVSLNGAAGDELFAGYGVYYAPAQVENLVTGRMGEFVRNLRGHSESAHPGAALGLVGRAIARNAVSRLTPAARWMRRWRPDHVRNLPVVRDPVVGASLSTRLVDDMSSVQMPYWLVSGDRGYMGVPVEVRAPFLDYRVVDFAFTLPASYLVRDGWHKWILRKAMEGLLPDDVLWRRRKFGFPFPYDRFVRESAPLLDVLQERASNPYVDVRDEAVRRDWRSLSFILWYESFFNDNRQLLEDLEGMARHARPLEAGRYSPEYTLSCA